jgi:hypothetical protein
MTSNFEVFYFAPLSRFCEEMRHSEMSPNVSSLNHRDKFPMFLTFTGFLIAIFFCYFQLHAPHQSQASNLRMIFSSENSSVPPCVKQVVSAQREKSLCGASFARRWVSNAFAKLRTSEYAKANYMSSGDNDMDNSRMFLLPMLTPVCGNSSVAPTRVGHGDGGKYLCLSDVATDVTKNVPCLVYSIGSRNEFSFETFIHSQKHCEVHTFDCTVGNPSPPSYVTYHNWCIGFHGQKDSNFHTFDRMVSLLGHQEREISLLKIDCEGWEWHFFAQYLSALKLGSVRPIRQISFELHACNGMHSGKLCGGVGSPFPSTDTWPAMNYSWPNSFIELFEQLYTSNYKVVSWEPNNINCCEYTVVLQDDCTNV